MPTTPIKCMPLCDLIDFMARLKAAEAIIALLASNGLQINDHLTAMNVLGNYQQLLQHEADKKMHLMENNRLRRRVHHG